MAKDDIKDKLIMGPDLGDGTHPFIRQKKVEDGVEISAGTASMSNESGQGTSVAMLRHMGGPEYEVKEEIRFTGKGPAQVSSDAYRKGWDGIFGKKTVGQA